MGFRTKWIGIWVNTGVCSTVDAQIQNFHYFQQQIKF